jgi:prefoldin subunit 5
MKSRIVAALALLAPCLLTSAARAQDVPGIEICTVEKTMERRTSCLQSNIDFLQKTIGKLTSDHQQKLDAANRQIEALKASMVSLQKVVEDLQAAQKKPDDMKKDDGKKKDPPAAPGKDAPVPK